MSQRAVASRKQGQAFLRPFQSLALTLFVHTQHQSLVRRREVPTHDIGHLFNKLRIVAELEGPDQMRLASGRLRTIDSLSPSSFASVRVLP